MMGLLTQRTAKGNTTFLEEKKNNKKQTTQKKKNPQKMSLP